MPATFAATRQALERLAEACPDLAPRTVLDVGAGPGTATFAAASVFGRPERATLLDRNRPFLELATRLADGAPDLAGDLCAIDVDVAALAATHGLAGAGRGRRALSLPLSGPWPDGGNGQAGERGQAHARAMPGPPGPAPEGAYRPRRVRGGRWNGEVSPAFAPDEPGLAPSDLVIAAYALAELPEPHAAGVLDALLPLAAGAVVIVEPGTPAGFATVRALRARLIAAGWHVAAPCPHDLACPVAGEDWCHFKVRLPRLKLHKALKDGDLGHEDEPFAFVAAARERTLRRPAARILAPPVANKAGVTLKLCQDGRVTAAAFPRRERSAFAGARRLDWGDGIG
jgi:ribosomal protein RSM22 (predicted rRNA methylase)